MASTEFGFPKLEAPFVRTKNDDGSYTATEERNEDLKWVFEDDSVKAIEKLDGENIAIYKNEKGIIDSIYTRNEHMIRPFQDKGKMYIIHGILDAFERGWTKNLKSGEYHYRELVGPKVQGNRYKLSNGTV